MKRRASRMAALLVLTLLILGCELMAPGTEPTAPATAMPTKEETTESTQAVPQEEEEGDDEEGEEELEAETDQTFLRGRPPGDYHPLRNGPGQAYLIVGVLSPSQRAPVVGQGQGGEWLQLDIHGRTAWIARDRTTIRGSLHGVPVVESIDSPVPPPSGSTSASPTRLCIRDEIEYVEMEALDLPIVSTTERILGNLGFEVVDAGECSTTLTLDIELRAFEGTYSSEDGEQEYTCYPVASILGKSILALPTHEGYEGTIANDEQTYLPATITLAECPQTPEQAPFSPIWRSALLNGLHGIWGKPIYLKALEDEDALLREAAAEKMLRPSGAISAVPALTLALLHDIPPVRAAAARALGEHGMEAVGALPAVIEAYHHEEDVQIRAEVVRALGQLADHRMLQGWSREPLEEDPIALLIQSSEDPHALIRARAAEGLGHFRSQSETVLPRLLELARQDEAAEVRANAVTSLGYVGEDSEEALDVITNACEDDDPAVQIAALRALRRFGQVAWGSIPQLIAVLDDGSCVGDAQSELTGAPTFGPCVDDEAWLTLKAITSQDFGRDAERWQAWWESNQ